jgi:hypothetical protein
MDLQRAKAGNADEDLRDQYAAALRYIETLQDALADEQEKCALQKALAQELAGQLATSQ